MSYDSRNGNAYDPSSGLPPSEAWLFAQAILGKPIPRIVSSETAARARREELERLAQFSTRHAEELRRLKAAETQARHEREVLEWAAQISTRSEEKLRALQRKETEEREAWRRAELFVERLEDAEKQRALPRDRWYADDSNGILEWDPNQPRVPAGSPQGGQWASKSGGGFLETSSDATKRSAI